MSHTPGPWTWTGFAFATVHGEEVLGLGDDGGCSDPECCGGPSYHIEVSEDDADLIAAAPDLLESCKEVSLLLNTAAMAQFDGEPWIERLRAAIAKAEGR